MELDLTRLTSLATKEHIKAPETAQKQPEEQKQYKPTPETKESLQGFLEGKNSILKLQRKADQSEAEKERTKRAEIQKRENIQQSNQLQTDILKGLKAGESVYSLFLKASKAISLMTGNTAFITQIEEDIKSIYGAGLIEPEPLKLELEQTEKRLERLKHSFIREEETTTKQRIDNAVKAHEARIVKLKELIEKGAENLG